MVIRLVEHSKERAKERGATIEEIRKVLKKGNTIRAKEGRKAKEMVFDYRREWLGKVYSHKKVKVIYVEEEQDIVVITVKVFYGEWR